MQSDVLRAKWRKFRNELSYHWAHLSPDELDGLDGTPEKLVSLLERSYGYARARAEREVERVVAEFEDKLRRAS